MSGSDRSQHHRPDQNPYNHSHIVDKQQDMTRQFPQYAQSGWQQQPQPQEGYHQLPPLTGSGQFVASPQSQYGPTGPQYDYQYSQRASSYASDMDVEMPGGRPGSYDSNRRRYAHESSSTPRGFHTYPHLPPPNPNESFPSQSQQWLSPPGGPQQPPQQQQQPQSQQPPSSTPTKNLRHLPGSLMDQDPHWENISQQGGLSGQSSEPQHRCMVGQPGMPEPAPSRGAKQRFTSDDDELLRKLKEEHNLSWTQIADFFPDRRSGTLQVRYCTKIKKREENWSEDNVNKLKTVVDDIRSEFWTQVSSRVGKGFTPQSCRDKWEELEAIEREDQRVRMEQESSLGHHESVKREYYNNYRT